jgi:hypothetical protein
MCTLGFYIVLILGGIGVFSLLFTFVCLVVARILFALRRDDGFFDCLMLAIKAVVVYGLSMIALIIFLPFGSYFLC